MKIWKRLLLFVLLTILSIGTYIYLYNYKSVDNNFFEAHKGEYKEMAEYILNNYFTKKMSYPCLYKYHQVWDICFPVDELWEYNDTGKFGKIDSSYLSTLFDKLRINSVNIDSGNINFSLRYNITTREGKEISFIDYITRDYKLKDFEYIKYTLEKDLGLYVIGNHQ